MLIKQILSSLEGSTLYGAFSNFPTLHPQQVVSYPLILAYGGVYLFFYLLTGTLLISLY